MALHFAARNGSAEIVEYLIDKASEQGQECLETVLECKNMKSRTPIMESCFRGYHTTGEKDSAGENRLRIVQCLVEAGALPNVCNENTKMTSLHWAAYNGDDGVVKYLLEYKEIQDDEEVRVVDPYVYSFNDQLPIDVAGHRPAVQCLDAFLAQF